MLLKIGVNYSPHENLLEILKIVETIMRTNNQLMVITSLKDREHSPGSKHYIGKAVDIRNRHIKDDNLYDEIFNEIYDSIQPIGKISDHETHWHIEAY